MRKKKYSPLKVWGKKLLAFYVAVIFKNEPNVEYTYFAHSRVIEFRIMDDTLITTDELKNYEPF
ncbi:hypothetical protein [Metasolibacillus sp. FSL K6-0083]|uniref:hypothetical protein n=1 Tax=Metasolibacillus sp. FSL K6-0083 TaxID=2921416 RepID=UPI00315A1048